MGPFWAQILGFCSRDVHSLREVCIHHDFPALVSLGSNGERGSMNFKDFNVMIDASTLIEAGPIKRRWMWLNQTYGWVGWILVLLLILFGPLLASQILV